MAKKSTVKRAKVTRVYVEITYSDGKTKLINVDPNKYEAAFWSDRSVNEIFGPFYQNGKVPKSGKDLKSLNESLKRKVTKITPKEIGDLWNSSLTKDEKGDRPAILLKEIKCIPHVPCKRCDPDE